MLYSPVELAKRLGMRIRRRRRQLGLTQVDAAERAGVTYRTWRRLERDGRASIDDLVRAALALRCEKEIEGLFPELAAQNMDELLARESRDARAHRQGAGGRPLGR
jgi:transcriptional regulator with XRE-family HTH domain